LLLLAGAEVDREAVRQALPAGRTAKVASAQSGTDAENSGPLAQRVMTFERATVLAELEKNGRNITQTAKALGLERSHLYKKCQQLGIDLHSLHGRTE
jgi:DNA-binding NtrC family response regulator